MKMSRLLSAAFVIGRRDFTATVFSKTFLFFLLGPLFPIIIGGVFGGIGANIDRSEARPVIAFIGSAADAARLAEARARIEPALGAEGAVTIRHFAPKGDLAAQKKALLAHTRPPVLAVLSGSLDQAELTGSLGPGDARASQMELIVNTARGVATVTPAPLKVVPIKVSSGSTASAQALTARAGQLLLFVLTILLAGMLLSQLIEEKSNKVIEVLAAAVPVDAIFVGKLFAMLAMSLVGITVWATAAVLAIMLLAPGTLGALPAPALGWPGFIGLGVVYFAMSYLLIGAAFLGIGSQASTVREVQTLSMPVTMSQVVIFALASAGADNPASPIAIGAAIFPLSSPFAMLARAAMSPSWWPHLVALGWQALWVALILRLAARLFRYSVLKSGDGRPWWKRWRRRPPPSGSAISGSPVEA
jgi:ABC-2 type transport system permease protein